MNKLSRFQFSFNLDLEKIQSCEKLMAVKKLVLGSVKRTNNVATTKNEEAITTIRRCKITLEDFWNVHVVVVQQLAMAKKE